MKENYTYPAILDYSDPENIDILFPTFNGMTCAESIEEAIPEAQDWLALQIMDCEDCGQPLPDEAQSFDGKLEKNQKLVYINVWMPYHRSKAKEVYIKKTLTIPAWLDVLAKQNSINFSETLVAALKEKLGLTTSK